jgi:hypothetical protein
LFGLAALVAGAALSCKSDPTADGVGTPSQVLVNFKDFNLNVGDSATVTAQVVDIRSTPLEQTITFTACDPSVTATVDPSYNPHPAVSERAIIHAVGPNATCVVASSTGAKPDTTAIVILPTTFGGALSASTLDAGQVLTISSTSTLKFDTSVVALTFTGGATPPFISKTPDALQVLAPFSSAGPIKIDGVKVTYVAGLVVTLNTSSSFTQTGSDPFPGDNAWNTAPDITPLLPATGQTAWVLATAPASNPSPTICPEYRLFTADFGPPAGKCALFKFTLAAPATLTFTTDWDGGSGDSDFLICSDSTAASFDSVSTDPGFGNPCIADGLAGASSSKPEVAGGVVYAAGTYWFAAQDFDGGGVKNFYIKIERH